MLMMLSSAASSGEAARCHEIGITACVTKPAGQAELLRSIHSALDTKYRTPPPEPETPHQAPPDGGHRLRILLAEDNVVNQRLALRLLEKHGHSVTLAQTGCEAVTATEAEGFDLAFMDVEMPEMDGLAATAVIRQREKASGKRLPIVAMTAHAMPGDKERCLAAGMDEYISKPIKAAELFLLVEKMVDIGNKPNFGECTG